MAREKKLFSALSRRGPHKVLRGDLGFAGIRGVVYTPDSGLHLPGLAFGHDWLTGVEHYTGTLEHLASWGIVTAAADTERGLAPSVLNLAADLDAVLRVISSVRLGGGDISVDPERLGVAGHGFGGSAALFAASTRERIGGAASTREGITGAASTREGIKAAAAVFPSVTKPSAEAAAASVRVPGLVLATPDDATSLRTDALEVAAGWDSAVLRVVDHAKTSGLAEKRGLRRLAGLPGSSTRTQRAVRALLTGFMLFTLTGDKKYRQFADPAARLPHCHPPDADAPPVTHEDRIVALFR